MWVVSFLSTSLLHMMMKKSARAPTPPRPAENEK
jgi:hypothetical protein